jgi:hypothetical protein
MLRANCDGLSGIWGVFAGNIQLRKTRPRGFAQHVDVGWSFDSARSVSVAFLLLADFDSCGCAFPSIGVANYEKLFTYPHAHGALSMRRLPGRNEPRQAVA